MPTITVKLDKKRADRLARWARRSRVPKSDVIRALIDRAGPIDTGDERLKLPPAKAWGWRRRSREATGSARQLLPDQETGWCEPFSDIRDTSCSGEAP
jgi:ribbon-helix-helix CopG family protein